MCKKSIKAFGMAYNVNWCQVYVKIYFASNFSTPKERQSFAAGANNSIPGC